MEQISETLALNGRKWPLFFWTGLLLIAIFWPLNWFLDGLRTHWGFFPMWLGYILTVEGFVYARQGHSMLSKKPFAYALLFPLSIPFWWIFEFFNETTTNEIYTPVDSFSEWEYIVLCTISFSTVLPAVFSTADLVSTFAWVQKTGKGPKVGSQALIPLLFFGTGWIMLITTWIWPAYSAAFLWMSIYFILDPISYRFQGPSLLARTASGDWRLVVALWAGCLICGFFWEFWNYYSSPKWIYEVPFVDFWYIFEMPLLGYLGYLPFALELYAMYAILSRWLPDKWTVFPGEVLTRR